MSTAPNAYSNFARRSAAVILNVLLIVACLGPFIFLLNNLILPHLYSPAAMVAYQAIRTLLEIILISYTMSWCTAHYGGSPGKLLLGLRVIKANSGEYLTLREAWFRFFMTVLMISSVVGLFIMFFNPKNQAPQDYLFNTIVIKDADDYALEPMDLDSVLL